MTLHAAVPPYHAEPRLLAHHAALSEIVWGTVDQFLIGHGIIDHPQYSFLIAAIMGRAVLPTEEAR